MKYKPWRGKKYKIDRDEITGLCQYEKRKITIAPQLSRQDLMDTAIHEILHVEFPNAKHDKVYHVAAELARVLDKLLEKDGHYKKGSESEGHELNAVTGAAGPSVHGDGASPSPEPEQGSEYEGWGIDRKLGS